jgi:SAM-dependent methyltransferase
MTELYPHVAGWLFDNEFRMLSELARGKSVLEIGCFQGRSTVALAETAAHVFSVDYFHGDDYTASVGHIDSPEVRKKVMRAWVDNTEPFEEKCSLLMGDMHNILPLLRPQDFELIFYDADHTAEAVEFFFDWVEKDVSDETIITLHDYKPGQGDQWQGGCDLMDAYHTRSGRLGKLVGSLITFSTKPLGISEFQEKVQ